jgi:hypothetical protein
MPRTYKPKIDPAALSGVHLLIWKHEHAETEREKVKAARAVSDAFIAVGGCGWCWSDTHVHAECDIMQMNVTDNQYD